MDTCLNNGTSNTPLQDSPDWSVPEVFQDLEACGAASVIKELVEAFRSDTIERLSILRLALSGRAFDRARAEVHSIKGSAHQMGAHALVAVCQAVEFRLPEFGREQLDEHARQLETHFETACHAMNTYATRLSAPIESPLFPPPEISPVQKRF